MNPFRSARPRLPRSGRHALGAVVALFALVSAGTTAASAPALPTAVSPAVAPAASATPAAAVATSSPADGGRSVAQGGDILLKSFLGLLLLASLAWVLGQPQVRRLEESLGVTAIFTTGFPFLALGLLARHPAVGVLTDDLMVRLTPVLDFGLGWLGLLVGMRFDLRVLDRLPPGTATAVALRTAWPFAAVLLVCGTALWWLVSVPSPETVLRNGVVLAAAGAMTARVTGTLSASDADGETPDVVAFRAQLDEVVGIAGLALLMSFFRPAGQTAWQLPGTAWLFVLIGLGVVVGLLVYATVRRPATGPEFLVVTIGSVAFSAGMSAYLRLPPLAVCFVVGTILANLPYRQRPRLTAILVRLERPLQLVFLAAVGAFWRVNDWRGWVLLPAFVLARGLGAGLARRATGAADGPGVGPWRLWQPEPVGLMAIALVVSVQSLYLGDSLRWLMSTVVGGAIVTEVIVQFAPRRRGASDKW